MLGASGIRNRRDAGEIAIEPFSEDRLERRGYDIVASDEVYRLTELGRPINPLHTDTVTDAIALDTGIAGEIVIDPGEVVTILSRERVALENGLGAVLETHPSLMRLGVTLHGDADGIRSPESAEAPTRLACTLRSAAPEPVVVHPDQPIARLRIISVEGAGGGAAPAVDAAAPRPSFEGLASSLVGEDLSIGITGLPASGKSVSATFLADLLDARTYGMGEVIRAEADRRGLDHTGENLNRVSQELRAEHGQGVVAERLVDRLGTDRESGVRIIEGIRGPAEVDVFRRELSDAFFLLGVHASRSTRIARLENRGRSDDAGGADALETRDEKESGFGLREAIGLCDHIITNEGSMGDLEREIERVAARICHQYG